MLEQGAELQERELSGEPMTARELDALIGDRDHLAFLNSRNEQYRALGWKARPPGRAEALARMAAEPNLIKRPILARGRALAVGFDEAAYRALLRR